ncbi:hypothetical protein [Halomonas sp. JS92-SW72]|uniref:hypothetical protein n=1 Tax=Halomonas sp. JS92-SW72 TaxID=2306583 RepID=UPI0013C30E6B|nr:hypothetical protein [Halomonas sp. JS92-SW72]
MANDECFAFEEELNVARSVLFQLPTSLLSVSLSLEGVDLEAWESGSMPYLEARQRLIEVAKILACIEPWSGSMGRAWDWYCKYRIAPLGGLTADELVSGGRNEEVMLYILHVSTGGWS